MHSWTISLVYCWARDGFETGSRRAGARAQLVAKRVEKGHAYESEGPEVRYAVMAERAIVSKKVHEHSPEALWHDGK